LVGVIIDIIFIIFGWYVRVILGCIAGLWAGCPTGCVCPPATCALPVILQVLCYPLWGGLVGAVYFVCHALIKAGEACSTALLSVSAGLGGVCSAWFHGESSKYELANAVLQLCVTSLFSISAVVQIALDMGNALLPCTLCCPLSPVSICLSAVLELIMTLFQCFPWISAEAVSCALHCSAAPSELYYAVRALCH